MATIPTMKDYLAARESKSGWQYEYEQRAFDAFCENHPGTDQSCKMAVIAGHYAMLLWVATMDVEATNA